MNLTFAEVMILLHLVESQRLMLEYLPESSPTHREILTGLHYKILHERNRQIQEQLDQEASGDSTSL